MSVITLNGKNLTLENLKAIAFDNAKVEIDPKAKKLAEDARNVLFKMAEQGIGVYGLNRGVGWNKDKEFPQEFFEEYNRNLLNTHCLGVPPYCTTEEVRATLAIRMNTVLCGSTGMSIEILELFQEYLNRGIHPRIPRRGSIGEADITTLSYIGLCFIGESEVEYKGEIMSSAEAMKRENLKLAILGPKDGLSILSSNAQGAALTAMLVLQTEELLNLSNLAYCIGLEGLNGGLDPLLEFVNESRGLSGQIECAAKCKEYLKGSYLHKPHPERPLQDALSFRCGAATNGAVLDALNYVKGLLHIQMNSCEDNPAIDVEKCTTYVSANFEAVSLAIAVEMLATSLSHLSKSTCYRTIKLSDPAFTKLTRFLTPDPDKYIGYGTIQKTFTSLDTENRFLANPSSMDFYSLAGTIEDHASNLPLVADKVLQMIDNTRYIIGLEMMHSAQAIDLRRINNGGTIELGEITEKAYNIFREAVPFHDKDRNVSIDIQNAYELIINKKLNHLF